MSIINDKKNRQFQKKDMLFTAREDCELLTFLLESLPNMSRNNVKNLLKNGAVYVNGISVTQYNHKLSIGQTISVKSQSNNNSPSNIIYEDKEIIVINKPAGLLSIATESEKENTAYRIITNYVRQSDPRNRIFVVHRLDQYTSGVLLFAKNEEIKRAFQNNWDKIVVNRGYTAIVEGKLNEKSGTIRSFLLETKTHLMYSGHSDGDGLEAVTEYRVARETSEYSLLDIRLLTGRKNQIRVHTKELGHPVIGDKKYGSTRNPIGRLGLHANLLELKHPVTNQNMRFEAPIPQEFSRLFN
ncbi:MAG: RluA family pseudouridine synthase [Oscillospiraceae bacterium]|nr:RluA family pseudouridine synthase [Oscillospiraceae bacterium]